MLTYNLNTNREIPLYVELYKCIKEDIERGSIEANEKLPSKRALAEHLGISIITVQNAYAQLVAEGYIYSKQRKGYFADTIATMQPMDSNLKLPEAPVQSNTPENKVKTINLCENTLRDSGFPFTTWVRQMRHVMSQSNESLLGKIPNMGLFSLRKAISDHLFRFRGLSVDPHLILIGAGTEYLYSVIIKLLGREKVYVVEDPGYKRISQIYNAEGVRMSHITLDECGLCIETLKQTQADVVHISPSHHFPTGTVMPIRRRMDILKWADASPGRMIIEDDYDSEFRFEGKPLPTMMSIDTSQNTIYMNTFSKTIAPSLRISYMVLTPKLAQQYNKDFGFYSCPVCGFEQHILANFIANGYFERHINRMRRYFKQKRDTMLHLIKSSLLNERSEVSSELNGLHFVLKLKTDVCDSQFKELAKDQGLTISFISDYCCHIKNCSSSELIVNYSGIEVADMKKAVDILSGILTDCRHS